MDISYFYTAHVELQLDGSNVIQMHTQAHLCSTKVRFSKKIAYKQGGRGHWAVYYTSPQSFIITLSNSLA